jgi:triphosphoribosyl-dephospho-CoA synthase
LPQVHSDRELPVGLLRTAQLARIGDLAAASLLLEAETWPKPGLVSHVDCGSHGDMDARTFRASALALHPFFVALASAGGTGMDELRAIGLLAEQAMIAATGGVNTHRGAIFGLGLLCAAAGALYGAGREYPLGSLGTFVCLRWGSAILSGPITRQSHGSEALRRYGAGGARAEAAAGFPHVYEVGLPALRSGRFLASGDENAARVHACFALLATLEDTNLLHRSGEAGLRFARRAARDFLRRGGVGQVHWQSRAAEIHHEFIARRLSPGGCADLLAMSLLVDALETPEPLLPADRPVGAAGRPKTPDVTLDLQMPYLVASAPYTDMIWRERRQRMLWSDR